MPPKKVKEEETGKIRNCYEHISKEFIDKKLPNPNEHLHHFSIPFRCIFVAPSGSGKTNLLTNLIQLFSKGSGTFANIYIICKDASEPLYKYLASVSDQIQVKEGLHNLPPLDKMDKELATLVVVDDCQLDKNQSRVEEYYIRCRKKSVSICYLAQNYYVVPKVIRSNCNYLVILRLNGDREMKMILKEGGVGMTKETLLNMYEYATNQKFMPLIIDQESTDKNHKYRRGFDEYLQVDNFT